MTNNYSTSSVSDRWNEENFEGMAKLWDLSDKDKVKMRDLQQRLCDIHHWKNDPYEVVRFYKELKGKLNKVEKMFRDMIAWRLAENIDDFMEDYGQPDPLFHQWPTAILNTTCREGDPIYVDRYGATDFAAFLKTFGPEETKDYNCIYLRELYTNPKFWNPYQDHVGRRVRQFTVICDCKGASLDLLRPSVLANMKTYAGMGQEYYPGWTKRIIMLRAPKIYSWIWPAAKPFLDKSLQDMMVVTSESDYLEVLQKYIQLDNLPPSLYHKGLALGMPGYFQRVQLGGGPLKGTPTKKQQQRESSTSVTCPSSSSSFDLNDWSERSHVVSAQVLLKGVLLEEPGRLSITTTTSSSSFSKRASQL